MLYTICIGLILVACVLIILAVLVQSPKSGMAANFGASNQVMGVRQTTDFLEKFTWTMAVVIFALTLLSTAVLDDSVSNGGSSIGNDAEGMIQQMRERSATMPQATETFEEAAVEAEEAAE